MRIIDCFQYFNEKEVLDIRLETLKNFVSQFVVVEANLTHTGEEKPWRFPKHYLDSYPITYVQYEFPKGELDPFHRDRLQREAHSQVIHQLHPDWVMVGDLDEIPNPESWNGQEGVFRMRNFYYKLNLMHRDLWNGTTILHYGRYNNRFGNIGPQDARNFRDLLRPVGGGWHFGWARDQVEKLKAFAHQEMNTPGFTKLLLKKENIVAPDGTTLSAFEITENGLWPRYIVEQKDNLKELIHGEN